MLSKIRRNFKVNKDIVLESHYESLFGELSRELDEENQEGLNYLKKYPQYHSSLLTLLAYYRFVKNSKGKQMPVILLFKGLEEESNHAEDIVREILTVVFEKYLSGKNEDYGYALSAKKTIEAEKFEENHHIEDIDVEHSFIEINEIEQLKSCKEEDMYRFGRMLNRLSDQITMIIRGTELELGSISSVMKKEPHFQFDLTSEYSAEEIGERFQKYFTSKGFILEEGWKEQLHYLINLSSEKVKGYSYYCSLLDRVEKEFVLDMNPKKQSGKYIIKNDYLKADEIPQVNDLEGIKKLHKLIGMKEAKDSVEELIAYLEFNRKMKEMTGSSFPLNLHMLFTGSPGTGKTTLARIIANILFELGYVNHNKLVEVDAKELVSQWVGETAIKTNEVIQRAKGGVLFIDEAYSVIENQHGKEAIAVLIKAMVDMKEELVVIFAGYEKEMERFVQSNPGIQSRIGRTIHFEDYTDEELLNMYEVKLNDYQIQTLELVKSTLLQIIQRAKKNDNFGNGRFVDNLIQEILFQHAVNTKGIYDKEVLFSIALADIPQKYQEEQIVLNKEIV